MSTNKKFSIAILIDNAEIPAWVYKSIKLIKQHDFVDIVAVWLYPQPTNAKKGLIKHLLDDRMERLFTPALPGPDYRKGKAVSNLFNQDIIRTFDPNAEPAPEQDCELLINYTDVNIQHYNTFPLGIWHHSFNNSSVNNKGYEGFWETMLSQPVIGSGLYMRKPDEDALIALIKSYSCPDKGSIHGTNTLNYWKTASFAARALSKINNQGIDTFINRQIDRERQLASAADPTYPAPGNWQYIAQFVKKVIFKLRRRLHERKYIEQWMLRFNLTPETEDDIAGYKNILPPKEMFWADPHIIFENGRYYIFIEELAFENWKGYLSVIEMDVNGNYSPPVKILECDYHLSYPNVFKHEGMYYMIPETYDNKTIELYTCIEFPHKWELDMKLMEGVSAADTTLLFEQGRWWMFTNIRENEGASPHDELFLFYSEGNDLRTTEWTSHPLNPIVSDVRNARPAGKIYRENGKIIRPSQNCSHHYGYGVNLNEITLLSETDYREEIIKAIEPDWDENIIATHTYNKEKDLTVMDAIMYRNLTLP